ncbi:MAG: response regulator [Spirosoma sp.]|nr:response regulator [Spirosoma sp.]
MNRNGPVLVIEDNHDDQFLLVEVFKKLGYTNQVLYFFDGQEALDYLQDPAVNPFLILSNINVPRLDGFALRDKIRIDVGLQVRCIPYLFFSTALNQEIVIKAYSLSAQGIFIKQQTRIELEKTISVIMEYWKRCASPNSF